VVVDRHDKLRLLVTTQLLEMAQSVGLAVLAFLPHSPIGAFYVIAAVGGCLLAIDNPVRRTFVNEMIPVEDRPNAVSLYTAMVNISRIGGPALAGVLVVTVGYGWAFAIDAVSYVAVLVALSMMRRGELRPAPQVPRGRGQVREGLRYVIHVPVLWISFAMLVIIGTASYNFTVVFPLFVEQGLGASAAAYSVLYSVFSLGALLGALAVARRQSVGVGTAAAGAAWMGVAMLAMSAVPNITWAVVAAAFVGAASVAFTTAAMAIGQVRTEEHMVGRVLALQSVVIVGTTPIGAPLLGLLSDAVGARAPLVLGGAAALVAAAFGLVAGRRLRVD
jgi:predicted MFS family arabinose efflux permease